MFSAKRPSVNVLGEASLLGEDNIPHYQTYADRISHVINLGLVRTDDPRLKLDPQEISRLGLRSLEGLENAAMRVYNRERSDDRMPTRQANDKAALIRSALTATIAQSPEQADTTPQMGDAGIMARNLEKAALAIHHQTPNDPGVKQILTLAAAAHNAGAAQAAGLGFENGSIIEAAAKQGRSPGRVAADLVAHKKLDNSDLRARVSNADILPLSEAIENIRPQRPQIAGRKPAPSMIATGPGVMLSQARQAEGRAMAMFANQEGSEFEKTTRQQKAYTMMASAFSVEEARQKNIKANTNEKKPTLRVASKGDDAR